MLSTVDVAGKRAGDATFLGQPKGLFYLAFMVNEAAQYGQLTVRGHGKRRRHNFCSQTRIMFDYAAERVNYSREHEPRKHE